MESFLCEVAGRPVRFDRIVAYYDVWSVGRFPYGKIRVKIIEQIGGGYFAAPNVAVIDPTTGQPDCIGGMGATVRDALIDAVKNVCDLLATHVSDREPRPEDFSWTSPEDF